MKERSVTSIAPPDFAEIIGSHIHILNSIYAGKYTMAGRHEPNILEISATKNDTEATAIEMGGTVRNWTTHTSLPDMRIMSTALYTSARDQFPAAIADHFRARRFMSYALKHFDRAGRVTHFHADWFSGTNYDAYYAALDEGATPWEAAASTWTARTLAELGFAPVPATIESLEQTTYSTVKTRISATFERI